MKTNDFMSFFFLTVSCFVVYSVIGILSYSGRFQYFDQPREMTRLSAVVGGGILVADLLKLFHFSANDWNIWRWFLINFDNN